MSDDATPGDSAEAREPVMPIRDDPQPAESGDEAVADESGDQEVADGSADEARADTEAERPDPDPQSEALRRQQLYVGTGVSALAGVAVVVAGIQQFPGFPVVVYILVGLAVTTLLLGLLIASMFAGATE